MPRPKKIVTRRANAYYIFTGPSYLVRPALPDELEKMITDMVEHRHVNRVVVQEELARRLRGVATDLLTVVELHYLRYAPTGMGVEEFMASRQCSRRYSRRTPGAHGFGAQPTKEIQ